VKDSQRVSDKSEHRKPAIDLAAAFITDCRGRSWYTGMLISVMLPSQNIHDRVNYERKS